MDAKDMFLARVLKRATALADDPEAQWRTVEAEVRANADLLGIDDPDALDAVVDDLIRIFGT